MRDHENRCACALCDEVRKELTAWEARGCMAYATLKDGRIACLVDYWMRTGQHAN
jgi:hypothetical protein